MTTNTFASVAACANDADFRNRVSEMHTAFAAVGMVQTSDTGQINTATVTKPGAGGTAAGYSIWRLADSSLFFKFEWGTSLSAVVFGSWVQVGTGSNGSGTLTGQLSTRSSWTCNNAPGSTVTPYTTYVCATNDALSIIYKANSWTSNTLHGGILAVGKGHDASGNPTTDWFGVFRCTSGTGMSMQTVRTASNAFTSLDNLYFTIVAGQPASSLKPNGDIQAYHIWMNNYEQVPFVAACTYILADLTELNTFPSALVGGVSHTYITLGQNGVSSYGPHSQTYASAALIWE